MTAPQKPYEYDRQSPSTLVSDLISRTAAAGQRPIIASAGAMPSEPQLPPPESTHEPVWTSRNTLQKRAAIVGAAIVALGVLYYVVGNSSSNSSSSSTSAYSAPASSSVAADDSSSPPFATQQPEPAIETPPSIPPGILGRAELRYCFRQGYRLDGMRAFVDAAEDNDLIHTFNRRVHDYNNRCGHMRFYEEDEQVVKAEVDNQAAIWRNDWRR